MAKQKYYAVKKGNKTGVFLAWEECQEAIKGFSGHEFKSFESEAEANAYLADEDIVLINAIKPRLEKGEVVAFTDGSFDAAKKMYGAGVVIFAPNHSNIVELSNRGNNEKYIELGNVAGEIIAVLSAIDWAWKSGFSKITIFHDYEGVSKWAAGEWKANKNLSQYYKTFYDDKKDVIEIEFVKVSGHSNNKYNDRADVLAKGAISENKTITNLGDNAGYIINNVKESEITDLLGKLKAECVGLDYLVVVNGNKTIWTVQFNKERLTISLFNNIKMVVQGKKSNLFQLLRLA
ncbi:MAG: ribonuclease H family protein [Clostridiales bacterium]|jgi:ribonuclease HI|nr:ribonuclease H family protein [Clostridiales bacterium]